MDPAYALTFTRKEAHELRNLFRHLSAIADKCPPTWTAEVLNNIGLVNRIVTRAQLRLFEDPLFPEPRINHRTT